MLKAACVVLVSLFWTQLLRAEPPSEAFRTMCRTGLAKIIRGEANYEKARVTEIQLKLWAALVQRVMVANKVMEAKGGDIAFAKLFHAQGLTLTGQLLDLSGTLYDKVPATISTDWGEFEGQKIILSREGTAPLNVFAKRYAEEFEEGEVQFSPEVWMGGALASQGRSNYNFSFMKLADPRLDTVDAHELYHAIAEKFYSDGIGYASFSAPGKKDYEGYLNMSEAYAHLIEARLLVAAMRRRASLPYDKRLHSKLAEKVERTRMVVDTTLKHLSRARTLIGQTGTYRLKAGSRKPTYKFEDKAGNSFEAKVRSKEILANLAPIANVKGLEKHTLIQKLTKENETAVRKEALDGVAMVEKAMQEAKLLLAEAQKLASKEGEPTQEEVHALHQNLRNVSTALKPLYQN